MVNRLSQEKAEKWCCGCELIKPVSEFCKNRTAKTGLSSWCKLCNRKYRISREPLHPRKLLSKGQLRAKVRKRANKWAARNPDKIAEYRMKKEYGLTMPEYNQKFAEQGGECFICKKTSKNKLSVDHDHTTGQVRGLLCSRCNFRVGMYEKDVTRGIEEYLNFWRLRRCKAV